MKNVLNIESKRSSLQDASGCIRIQRALPAEYIRKKITFKRLERREAGGGKSSVELHQISRAWSLLRPELLWELLKRQINTYKYYRMLAVYGLYRSACTYRLGGEKGEVYDFEWGSGAVCGEVDFHVQPRS